MNPSGMCIGSPLLRSRHSSESNANELQESMGVRNTQERLRRLGSLQEAVALLRHDEASGWIRTSFPSSAGRGTASRRPGAVLNSLLASSGHLTADQVAQTVKHTNPTLTRRPSTGRSGCSRSSASSSTHLGHGPAVYHLGRTHQHLVRRVRRSDRRPRGALDALARATRELWLPDSPRALRVDRQVRAAHRHRMKGNTCSRMSAPAC